VLLLDQDVFQFTQSKALSTLLQKSAIALSCDSRCFRRQIDAEIGDYAYSRQCGQALITQYLYYDGCAEA